jgi:hypothetical protein
MVCMYMHMGCSGFLCRQDDRAVEKIGRIFGRNSKTKSQSCSIDRMSSNALRKTQQVGIELVANELTNTTHSLIVVGLFC